MEPTRLLTDDRSRNVETITEQDPDGPPVIYLLIASPSRLGTKHIMAEIPARQFSQHTKQQPYTV